MKKRSLKLIIACVLIGCTVGSGFNILAVTDETKANVAISEAHTQVKTIQKQLNSIVEMAYEDKLENRSSDAALRMLDLAKNEVNGLLKKLGEYQEWIKLDSLQEARLQSLIISANLLNYMDDALVDYINANGAYEQLRILKVYFKLDAVLTQFNIDYDYFDMNFSEIPTIQSRFSI